MTSTDLPSFLPGVAALAKAGEYDIGSAARAARQQLAELGVYVQIGADDR